MTNDETMVFLEWSDQRTNNVTMSKANPEDCLYRGIFGINKNGNLLLTGCKDEIRYIRIHSSKYGNHIATLVNGTLQDLPPDDTDDLPGKYVYHVKCSQIEPFLIRHV